MSQAAIERAREEGRMMGRAEVEQTLNETQQTLTETQQTLNETKQTLNETVSRMGTLESQMGWLMRQMNTSQTLPSQGLRNDGEASLADD